MSARPVSLLLPPVLAVTVALACRPAVGGAGSAPASGPEPQATVKALINASVQVTLRATVDAIGNAPLRVHAVDQDAGVVETEYEDLTPLESRVRRYPLAERVVRFQFRIQPDTLGRGARLSVLALYQPRPPRAAPASGANERPVPRNHPAAEFARRLVEKIERKALAQ